MNERRTHKSTDPGRNHPTERHHASACWKEADRQMEGREAEEFYKGKKLISKREAYRPWEDKKISQNYVTTGLHRVKLVVFTDFHKIPAMFLKSNSKHPAM